MTIDLDENTELEHPGLIPEIPIYQGNQSIVQMWHHLDVEEPPYWMYAWAGGQSLARWTFDNSSEFRGKRVIDFGAGTGINGIAAGFAGASRVTFVDKFEPSLELSARNWFLNALPPGRMFSTVGMPSLSEYDILLLGDCFYEFELTEFIKGLVDKALAANVTVYVGDPGREYLPRRRVERLAKYTVPNQWMLEKRATMPSYAFKMGPP
jgi:predicted nicotinamide N-methyase